MPVEEQMNMISNETEAVTYPLMEHFYTLQGEGFHQGRAAYFVRLAGCDVGCVWCDVKESWDKDKHPKTTVGEILQFIKSTPTEIVVITGGEPFMYNLDALITALHINNYKVHIETSGAYPISGKPDWICLSPKKFKLPLDSVIPHAHELKVVVYNKSDLDWAEKYAALVNPQCKLFLQPEWEKSAQMTPLIIDYIKQHPQWEFSLQMHKYIHVP
jgi:7-carboxy-7-deazaguanine synthase